MFKSRGGLAREITTLLLIKAVLLLVLWRLFFAHAPISGADGMADTLLGASAASLPQVTASREVRP